MGVCRQASSSPGRRPPDKGGPQSLDSGYRKPSGWMEEGWLCNYDTMATEKVTLLRSTASFLPVRRA